MKTMSESQLVKWCLDYLATRKIFAWRANSGAVTAEYKGKKRFVRFSGAKGLSDIIGILPSGRFLAIEAKVGRNKPTEAQEEFLARVRASGGVAAVVYTPEDMIAALTPKVIVSDRDVPF